MEGRRPPPWLVDGILPVGGLAVLIGAPSVGKSFLGLDLALCVASGQSWLGTHPVTQGDVLYVASEGGWDLGRRLGAWKHAHRTATLAGIYFMTDSIDLMKGDDVEALMEAVDEFRINPILFVFDTLARCMDGDENATKDMNRIVRCSDRVRAQYVIHARY